MIKTKQVGGPTDFTIHPAFVKHISYHPKHEDVATEIIEAATIDFPTGM